MAAAKVFSYLFILIALFGVVASEPDHLRDLCVANKAAGIKVNGFPCKDKANVTEADFFFTGLANPGAINNSIGSVVTGANVDKIPGFITTANKLISKSIKKGDIFVFAKGLVHFLKNNGAKPASVIAGFNSQLPGTQFIAATLFTSTPPVPDNALTKTFQIGTKEVNKIKNKLAPKKS
ncbi:Germin-like protein 16 [Theobroma cacao]|uniref:Germin-like protein n=1 Tax=Theobroma cacao TaxID=3641 RepID=A0A061GCX8_THECC|nr:Germin-like protein 16 [Theobroma cacao]